MKITGTTKLICLIGSPVAHSLSPAMHNRAFEISGLDFAYLAFDVKPGELEAAVRGLTAIGAAGFNVTMPNKTEIMKYMDTLSPAATLAGAVNTVVIDDGGRLHGDNTDGEGFLSAARGAGFNEGGAVVTLLGAGGAARAICAAVALCGVRMINIFRRKRSGAWDETISFAEKCSKESGCAVNVYPFEDVSALAECVAGSDMLVNATNIGMAPGENETPLPAEVALKPTLIVGDVIYNPRETMFLKAAKRAGCRTFGGSGMVLMQGAASFERWTGMKMPADEIRKEIFSDEL